MVAISLAAIASEADRVNQALSGLGILIVGVYLILLALFMAFAFWYLTAKGQAERYTSGEGPGMRL